MTKIMYSEYAGRLSFPDNLIANTGIDEVGKLKEKESNRNYCITSQEKQRLWKILTNEIAIGETKNQSRIEIMEMP